MIICLQTTGFKAENLQILNSTANPQALQPLAKLSIFYTVSKIRPTLEKAHYLRSTELCDLGLLVAGGAVRGLAELEPKTALSASLAPVKAYTISAMMKSNNILKPTVLRQIVSCCLYLG